MRIAVGGFQHETNTFAPVKASYDAFERADAWPPLSRGPRLLEEIDGVNLPVAGAAQTLREAGVEVVPLAWCSATPSAHVTDDAFGRVTAILAEELTKAGRLDGVYLDLHGAMVTESHEDGEGEVLRMVRNLVGPDLPVAVSLDLHANVTEQMTALADVIDIYRRYPHTDLAETGARTAGHLLRLVRGEGPWRMAFRKAEFLVPLTWGCTFHDPAQTLYDRVLPELIGGEVRSLALALGFHLADIRECGPSVVAYAASQRAADAAADALIDAVHACEPEFAGRLYSPEDAVAEAQERVRRGGEGPVVIADTQDNPGGGGPGDTTGMLRALIAGRAQGAVIGVFTDPESAARAHAAGEGARVRLAIGGRLFPGDEPVEADCHVLALGDGAFRGTGPMWGGANFRLGPMALVETEGVRVVIASKPMQAGDQSMFRHLGVEPAAERILVLKSSVHYRADFQPIARAILVAAAPGPVYADPGVLDYRNLRAGVRRVPGRR